MTNIKKYGLFTLVCIIFGNTFLAISIGLHAGASPLFFAAVRFISAGIIMLMFLLLFKKTTVAGMKKVLFRSAILSIFMTAGTFGFMFLAQTHVNSGYMARLDSIGPILTTLLTMLFLKKRLSRYHIPAFILGSVGISLIASPEGSSPGLYIVFACVSVFLYSVANAIYPVLFNRDENPILISALQSLCGGLLLLVIALFSEQIVLPTTALGSLLYLTIGGSIIGHTATLILVRDAGPVFASSWLYVAPVIATFSGFIVLQEDITILGVVGTFIALVGTFILFRAERLTTSKVETVKSEKSA